MTCTQSVSRMSLLSPLLPEFKSSPCASCHGHYYIIGLRSRPFVPAAFGPGTISGFCPGWRHQPGQNGGILSRLVVPTGTKGYAGLLSRLVQPTGTKGLGPLIPFPLPPPESFSSLVFLLFLARDRGVLAHFFTTFVKIFDSPSIHRR